MSHSLKSLPDGMTGCAGTLSKRILKNGMSKGTLTTVNTESRMFEIILRIKLFNYSIQSSIENVFINPVLKSPDLNFSFFIMHL